MNGMILRLFAWVTIFGAALWSPGAPVALAQVDFHDGGLESTCHQEFDPATTTDPALAKDPELCGACAELFKECQTNSKAAEDVEKTAVVIHETTEATKQAVANPDSVAKNMVEVLAKNGVPTDVAGKVETQMKDALTKAKETFQRGGTLEDAAKYFETCQKAMADCSGYLGGKDFKEIFTAGGLTGDLRSVEFMGSVIDPSQKDVMEAAMKAHFEAALRSGMEGGAPSPEAMKEMMEKMSAAGINPREMAFHGGLGEFQGPSPEAMAAMTPEQKAGYEAWKSGDFSKVQEMAMQDSKAAMEKYGMTPEQAGKEMEHMKEMMEKYKELAAVDEKAFTNFQASFPGGGTPTPSTEVLTASHDHLPAGAPDGVMDEYHYTNADGSNPHTHTAPH